MLAALPLLLGACLGAPAAGRERSPSPPAAATATATTPFPSPSPSPSPAPVHVYVIVLENTGYATALAQPAIAALAGRYGLATDYHAVAHPSLPNYLALTAGDTFGIADDSYHRLPATGLGAELDQHGLEWRAYFEGFSAGCFSSPYPYALKHDPFAYYGGNCPPQAVDIGRLAPDLALSPAQAPRLSWITPGLCHDGHDCGPGTAAQYLQGLVSEITAAPAWQAGGVLFVTWDEDDGGGGNHVPLLVITPAVRAAQSGAAYDHYSLLATVEDLLGVPRLGRAQTAAPINDLVAVPPG